jgi:prefoldin alpha subunit
MVDEETKKKLEEKYLLLQLMDAQIKELEKELIALETQNQNIIKLKENMSSLEKVKANSKSFSAIGAGIYSESEIKDTKQVLINVGAGVFVKKNTAETSDLLTAQLTQSKDIIEKLALNLQNLSEKATEIQIEIQDMVSTKQNV